MVGDGVNDAPALARAGVTGVIRLSRASYRKMIQNLAWAAGYNVLAIPLAAGVLAWAGFTLSPAVGAVLMSASTIVVALNAQLLRRVDLSPSRHAGRSGRPGRGGVRGRPAPGRAW
jgi:Cu2+-exporting ATPase